MPVDFSPQAVAELVSETPWLLVLVAVLVEDVACLVSGVLVGVGGLPVATALGACWFGTLLGDALLWGLARLVGPSILSWRLTQRVLSPAGWEHVRHQIVSHAGRLVVCGRLVPGLRVPTYLGAGAAGLTPAQFLPWASLAACIWVGLLVGLGALLGEASFVLRDAASWVAVASLTVCGLLIVSGLRRRVRQSLEDSPGDD